MTGTASRRETAISLAVLLVLTTLVAGNAKYLLPTYLAMLAGMGASLGFPSRLALTLTPAMTWLAVVVMALLAYGLWRARRDGHAGWVGLAAGFGNLAMALLLALQLWVYVDFAIVMPVPCSVPAAAAPAPSPDSTVR